MRVFILAIDEPFYLPLFLEGVVRKNRDSIVGMAIFEPFMKNQSWLTIMK